MKTEFVNLGVSVPDALHSAQIMTISYVTASAVLCRLVGEE